MPGVRILGTGRFAPGKPITNEALTRVMDTNDEWIRQRTGIEQRHFAAEGQGVSDLALEASKIAVENAGIALSEIDYILCATMTPDHVFPGSGGLLGAKLGIAGVPALDIRQQCGAFVFGIQVADGLLASGAAKTILFVGAEVHAGFMPWEDWGRLYGETDTPPSKALYEKATKHRGLAVIFGDGAGAMILRKTEEPNRGLLDVLLHTDGRDAKKIYISGGGFVRRPYWTPAMFDRDEQIPQMDGRYLFKTAVTKLPPTVREILARNNLTLDDVKLFVCHQANERINTAVRDALGLPAERFPSNIARYGNTSAGTIPILLDELVRDGRIERGDLLCFIVLGAGLHWGAALMRW